MSDCEETDFFWESWTSPGKSKRKKDQKCLKRNNNVSMKADKSIQKKKKKKKNSKFKEAMEGRKGKKKDKKKMKNRLASELDDSCGAQSKPTAKPEAPTSRSNEQLNRDPLTQDSKKRTKRTKKVAFDLSPAYVRVKRPKFVSSSQHCPKESVLVDAARARESCAQVTATGHGLGQTCDNDSQGNSEDINSQDLFITQKTFRASPSEPSSGEASDKAAPTTPHTFPDRDQLHTSVVQIKQHLEESYKCPQDSHFHVQHHRKKKEHAKKQKTAQVLLTEEEEEEEELNKAHQNRKMGKLSFQARMELNANLTTEKDVSCPVRIKQSVVKPYLEGPIDAKPSLDVAKSKKQSMTSTSTQTEHFFTTELSTYLSFCQKSRAPAHFEDLQPLDLSLEQRARKDPNLRPSSSSGMKDVEAKSEPSGRRPCSASTPGRGETTASPQSESEPKSADTTTSSEDNEPPCRTGKLDLAQVRAVQMRLNESFFFKTRGEGQSPRPASPLMKLAQSREAKSRKGH